MGDVARTGLPAHLVVPLVLAIFLAGCSSGCPPGEPDLGGACLDPKDPCPNDMQTDESGCGWDRCAGDFTGNLIPCWFTDPALEDVSYFKLAGARAQYVAYVKKADVYAAKMLGPIWL